MTQETKMTQTTFENTYNQFIPKVFNNPILGKFTVLIDQSGQLWFIGSEVARGLGYRDPDQAIRMHVSASNKQLVSSSVLNPLNQRVQTSRGGARQYILISEQGLYALITQS